MTDYKTMTKYIPVDERIEARRGEDVVVVTDLTDDLYDRTGHRVFGCVGQDSRFRIFTLACKGGRRR